MSWGNGAPRGWPGEQITASELNTLIPYGQLWLPAGCFTASANLPGIWHPIQINSQEQALDAWECVAGNQSEMFTLIDLKGAYVNWADPQFRVRPVWFQIADEEAPSPTEYVLWNSAILNVIIGGSYDRSNNVNEYSMLSPVLDAWEKSGGTGADPEAAIGITAINGDAFETAKSNSIMLEIERHSGGGYPSDTYGDSAYLLGVGLQYKTNFTNTAQWAT